MGFFDYSGEVLAGQELLCYCCAFDEHGFFLSRGHCQRGLFVRVAVLGEC
jgi:hypothetical protein